MRKLTYQRHGMSMKIYWYLLCVIVACLVLPASGSEVGPSFCYEKDPCQIDLPTLDVDGRSTTCPYYGQYGQCDASLTERWYRVDVPMVTTCPAISRCGTRYPIWLNGTLPTSGINVTRKACMRGYTSCCEQEYTIVLKKCTTFMAYCLQHTAACAERYCFGTSGYCPVSTISTGVTTVSLSSTASVSQLPTTTTTPATNTIPGDTPSDPTVLVGGIIGGVLTVAVICVIIGAVWKRQGGCEKIRKDNDTHIYSEVGGVVSDSAQYTTLDINTVAVIPTYTGLRQPNQTVDVQERHQYEVALPRNQGPLYDVVNTEIPQMSTPATRNQDDYRSAKSPVPIYETVNDETQTTRNQYEVLGPLNPDPAYLELNKDNQGIPAQITSSVGEISEVHSNNINRFVDNEAHM